MKYLQPYLYGIVRRLAKEREDAHLFPFVAIENDIIKTMREDIRATLQELVDEKLLSKSQNINGIGLFRHLRDLPEKDEAQV